MYNWYYRIILFSEVCILMRDKLLLIDAYSIICRGFYALPLLANSKGLHTNAVLGFLNILYKTIDEEKPKYIAVAFDENKPTFRHELYKEYKGNRSPMPEELKEQVPYVKEILKEENYRCVEEKREQINAVLYLVKTGCQWRNLPIDFPKWKTVYSFYRRACLNGTWLKIQKALVEKVRIRAGKKAEPSYALIDSQSAKAASANEGTGYDGGKKRKAENDTL